MAHDEHRKAQAMALLALGNSPRYVARKCGIPLMTVRRWKKEVFATIRIELPDLSDLARTVRYAVDCRDNSAYGVLAAWSAG